MARQTSMSTKKAKEEYFKAIEPYLQIDCSVHEACLSARVKDVNGDMRSVPLRTVYDWIEQDEEFAEMVNKAKDFAVNLARKTVIKAIKEDDASSAKWFLEKRRKDIYGPSMEVMNKNEVVNDLDEQLNKLNEAKGKTKRASPSKKKKKNTRRNKKA